MSIEIIVAAPEWRIVFPHPKKWGRQIVTLVLDHLSCERKKGFSILLTTNTQLQDLNARFRGKDKPTNVLSFPSSLPTYWGDIALALETCLLEAAEQGKSPHDHATHLLVHGILHVLGYDHEEEEDALIMEGLEISLLEKVGITNPYQQEALS